MAKKTVNAGKSKSDAGVKKAAKKTGGNDAQWEFLARELRGLIPQLDSEGLAFLVEQGRVHLYNMQVEKLNQAAEAADAASARATSLTKKPGVRGAAKGAVLRLEGTESGSSYYLYYGNNEIMFSRNEMVQLVKIANGEGTDTGIRARLYSWFDRERTDVFAVVPISGKSDPKLTALAEILRNTFKLRKG